MVSFGRGPSQGQKQQVSCRKSIDIDVTLSPNMNRGEQYGFITNVHIEASRLLCPGRLYASLPGEGNNPVPCRFQNSSYSGIVPSEEWGIGKQTRGVDPIVVPYRASLHMLGERQALQIFHLLDEHFKGMEIDDKIRVYAANAVTSRLDFPI